MDSQRRKPGFGKAEVQCDSKERAQFWVSEAPQVPA